MTDHDLTDPTRFQAWEEVSLRYSDQDAMGHVNNVAYAAFFEAGRMGLFSGLLEGHGDQRFNFVLASVKIDYVAEMTFPGVVRVGGRLLGVGRKSVTTGYAAFVGERLHATSVSVNVFFDPVARRSAPLPAGLRAGLEAALEKG